MIKNISENEAKEYGIFTNHELMENGELRFRLKSTDGSGYIRTVSGNNVQWQNSHYHKSIKEIYIVQKGWIAFAEYIDKELKIKIYRQDEYVISNQNVIHNVYLAPNSIVHTAKYGNIVEDDWFPCDGFNKITKKLTEEEILRIAK